MKFYKLYNSLLEKLDPEVEAVWGDIVPQLGPPVTYYCITILLDRSAYDVWFRQQIKARTLEEAQDIIFKQAEEDWKESWYENAESARDDFDEDVDPDDAPENEYIEKLPIQHDDVALVGSSEDSVVVISPKKLTDKQASDYVKNFFEDN